MPYEVTHSGSFFERLEDREKSSIWFRLTAVPNETSWIQFEEAFVMAYGVYPRFDMIIECVVRLKDIPPQFILSMMGLIKRLIPRSKKQIRCTAIVSQDVDGIRGIMAKRPPSTDWRFSDTVQDALGYISMKLERETNPVEIRSTRITKAKCIDVFMRVAFDLLDDEEEDVGETVVPEVVSVPSSC